MIKKIVERAGIDKDQPFCIKEAGLMGIFVGAISILLLVGGVIIIRLVAERSYREKWKEYNDCGWA